jgi:hypothetical protein
LPRECETFALASNAQLGVVAINTSAIATRTPRG